MLLFLNLVGEKNLPQAVLFCYVNPVTACPAGRGYDDDYISDSTMFLSLLLYSYYEGGLWYLGEGAFLASLAFLLKSRGFRTSAKRLCCFRCW